MKPSPYVLATSALLTLLGQSAARAESLALSFDLPPAKAAQPVSVDPPPLATVTPEAATDLQTSTEHEASAEEDLPLPVPLAAANPPISPSGQGTLPGGFGGGDAIAMAEPANSAAQLLPPPPPLPPTAVVAVAAAPDPEPEPLAVDPVRLKPVALSFEMGPGAADIVVAQAPPVTHKPAASPGKGPVLSLFEGGPNSLVARTVGSAEGTRTADGQRTPAYFGHVDPGNGVWNLGTFSYQHGASTPEEADVRQLRRLQAQTALIQQKAQEYGLELSLQETLNAIDLANQAPLAALGREGYVDWLAQARKLGKTGDDAIVWARTRSFLDPDTQRWNAPGLGNNVYSISRDQERRMLAIARALEHYQKQQPTPVQTPIAAVPTLQSPTPEAAPTAPEADPATDLEPVDSIFHIDLEPTSPQPTTADSSEWSVAPGLAAPDWAPAAETPAPAAAQSNLDVVGAAPETEVFLPVSRTPDANLHSAAPTNPMDLLLQVNV